MKSTQEQAMQQVSTEKLMRDLRAVVVDAEELLKATAAQTGERVDKVRAKAEDSLRTARARLQEMGDNAQMQAREAAREVEQQVRDNPWTAVGIAAGVGLVLGILLGRR
jgi:ElaB/YqjD/DUF883 family membrane-anchored ribosome-binding protein